MKKFFDDKLYENLIDFEIIHIEGNNVFCMFGLTENVIFYKIQILIN